MNKIVALLVVLICAAVLAWPYLSLYRLDRALAANDLPALAELVDVESVRGEVKAQVDDRVKRTVGGKSGTVLGWIQTGVSQIGSRAVDLAVNLEWVADTLRDAGNDLRNGSGNGSGNSSGNSSGTADATASGAGAPSLLNRTTYAFYERWDQFLVRIGDLDRDPLHVRLALRGGSWKVVGIYD